MLLLSYLLTLCGLALTAGAVFNLIMHRKGHPTAIFRARTMLIAGIACLLLVAIFPESAKHTAEQLPPPPVVTTPAIPQERLDAALTACRAVDGIASASWDASMLPAVELDASANVTAETAIPLLERLCRELSAHGVRPASVSLRDLQQGQVARKICP